MQNTKNILDYFSFLEKSYVATLHTDSLSGEDWKAIQNKLELIRQFRAQIEWQLISSEEKQAKRLRWLASYEKRGMDVQRKKELTNLYAAIKVALPHVIALNQNGRLNEFKNLCYRICEIIDFKGRAFKNLRLEDIAPFEKALEEVKEIQYYPVLQDSKSAVIQLSYQIAKVFDIPDQLT